MFKVGENDISNAIQTAAFQTLSKYYLFFNLFLYEFHFVLSNLKKNSNYKSWKVPYVVETSKSLTGHHRVCCGMGGGSDLLDI